MNAIKLFAVTIIGALSLTGCRQTAEQQNGGGSYPLLTVKPADRNLSVK